MARDVSYEFGHGLSYTRFDYDDLQATADGDSVDVSCRVTNTGERRGKEVAQLYVGDPAAAVLRPPRELKGFTKVDLEPGESTTVTLPPRRRATSPTGTAAGCSSPASSRSPSAPPRATCA